MKTFGTAELVSSLVQDKVTEVEVLKHMLDSGVISDDSKLQLLQAQLNFLIDLEMSLAEV